MTRLFKAFFLPFFVFATVTCFAQSHNKHLVYFKDKANSPYSFSRPEQFLSQAALERRQKYNIALNTRDLPVNPVYVTGLKALGAEVLYTTKWFNGAIIQCDSAQLTQVLALPFVKSGQTLNREIPPVKNTPSTPEQPLNPQFSYRQTSNALQYGESFRQAEMIGAHEMHALGFRGEGMTIAVFDNGFQGVDQAFPFAHLYQNNQVKGVFNFVNKGGSVYARGNHGTQVLSNISAYQPGKIIGTAYKANVFLLVTEDNDGENPIEEANWLIAAEFADSAGADVINSSLGYSTFDDPRYNYTYAQMDGNTAIVTRAADLAAATGMLVVTSAGNEGNSSWRYVTAPADADSVLTVGAVDSEENIVGFSSIGPAADGRIKPNLAAMGFMVAVVLPNGELGRSSGTSFSGPILAGLATGFWQANPQLNNMQVIDYLQRSASQANDPDNNLGYGIPNFSKALQLASKDFGLVNSLTLYPNPTNSNFIKLGFSDMAYKGKVELKMYDQTGRLVKQITMHRSPGYRLEVPLPAGLSSGLYVVQVGWADQLRTLRFVKLP